VSSELGHRDETGGICTRHPAAALDPILQLAAIGTRMASFNHDLASKIQGLMMALDEITELATEVRNPDLERAAETAHTSLRELGELLTANRTLTKPPVKSRVTVRELVLKAGERVGVALRGTLPETSIEVAVVLAQHGLALAFDVAAGTGRNRRLDLTVSGHELTAAFAETTSATASETLAIAAFLLAREGGQLCCTTDARLVIRLPPAS
jgi:hypothetical protein